MSTISREPVLSKTTERGENDRLEYAVSSMQGYRANMEDAVSKNHPDTWFIFGEMPRPNFLVFFFPSMQLLEILMFPPPHRSLVFMMAMEVGIHYSVPSSCEKQNSDICMIQI